MTIDEIKKLVQVVLETKIAELEVHLGENWVRIKNPTTSNQEIVLPAVMPVSLAPATAQALATPPAVKAAQEPLSPPAPLEEEQQNIVVKSPIVGTYYDAPAPDMSPFVRIGDRVEPKQVLCIIESMKLMNEIEADHAGIVVAKHVENGHPVEYGETLFTLRPV